MQVIDEDWIRANPAAALAMIERLTVERENAVNLASAVANDSATLRRELAEASAGGTFTPLLNRIEAHLRATGTSDAAFGQAVMGDPCFVRRLREGAHPQKKTEARVRAYLDPRDRGELPPPPGRRRRPENGNPRPVKRFAPPCRL